VFTSAARTVAASLAACSFALGTAIPAVADAAHHTSRDETCAQATASYDQAKDTLRHALRTLAAARKRLHHAHAHGTAEQFQVAKNAVRKARGKVFNARVAVAQASATVDAVC
jgi:hypothetical protein